MSSRMLVKYFTSLIISMILNISWIIIFFRVTISILKTESLFHAEHLEHEHIMRRGSFSFSYPGVSNSFDESCDERKKWSVEIN